MRAASVTAGVAAASALFGLLREVVAAAYFGADVGTDAFYFSHDLAVRFPEMVVPAITAAFIPLYFRCKTSEARTELVNSVLTLVALVLAAFSVLTFVAAPGIVGSLATGFEDPQRLLAAEVLRILSPATLLLGVVGVLKAVLEAQSRFFVAQTTQIFSSLGVIAGVVWLSESLDTASMAVGLSVAATAQIGWTVFWLRRSGFTYRPQLRVSDPTVGRFFTLLWPGVISSVLVWMIPIIDKSLASSLEDGAIAALSFGNRPVALAERVGIHSLAIVGLPIFSAHVVDEGHEHLGATLARVLRGVVLVMVPLSLLTVALRVPIVELLFQRGAFDASATGVTSGVLGALALGLAPMAIAVTISTAFKSLEDTKTPAFYGAGSMLASKAILSPLLMIPFGVTGLALATTIMYIVSGSVLIWRITRSGADIEPSALIASIARIGVATIVAVAPVQLLVDRATWSPVTLLVVGSLTALLLFFAIARLFRFPELGLLTSGTGRARRRDSGGDIG